MKNLNFKNEKIINLNSRYYELLDKKNNKKDFYFKMINYQNLVIN